MNHRDRNVHVQGFKVGYISRGYKPKETVNGIHLVMWLIAIVAGLGFLGRLFNIV